LFERLRLVGRGRGVFRERGFRLNVDGHFFRRFDPPRLEIDDRKRGGVEREHDRDDDRAEPWRADGRRLEDASVQRRGGHGTGAFGVAEVGAFGAGEVGALMWRGPDTMAIREIPFAASSSITDTTSP
jgi:hypothetical protein